MKSPALFFLLVLSCMCLSLAQGSYGDCCLSYVARQMPAKAKRNVESYKLQETDGDCNIRAVVFLMKKKKSHRKQHTRCANPHDQWVQELIETLNMRTRN